jgi:CheY-like chemotaxis protein
MKILFIDDDKAPIRYYLEELKDAGYDVIHRRNPDEAIETLREEGCAFHIILLDSAMPPGKRFEKSETEEGLTTGSLLFSEIRKLCPDVPIIILTNFGGLEWMRKACAAPNVLEVRKLDVMPVQLVENVKKMIREYPINKKPKK